MERNLPPELSEKVLAQALADSKRINDSATPKILHFESDEAEAKYRKQLEIVLKPANSNNSEYVVNPARPGHEACSKCGSEIVDQSCCSDCSGSDGSDDCGSFCPVCDYCCGC